MYVTIPLLLNTLQPTSGSLFYIKFWHHLHSNCQVLVQTGRFWCGVKTFWFCFLADFWCFVYVPKLFKVYIIFIAFVKSSFCTTFEAHNYTSSTDCISLLYYQEEIHTKCHLNILPHHQEVDISILQG